LKKRDMPGDDSDFFDNVIEWKKRCTMCVKGIENTHTVCYIKTRNTYKVYKSWW
jgi:rRNA maturation endonuclease Nob1